MSGENEKTVEDYIEFVNKMIVEYQSIGNLVSAESECISPERINGALAMYYNMSLAMCAEYQRQKIQYEALKREYDRWSDETFEAAKLAVMNEYEDTKVKPSLKEFETRARTMNRAEYDRRTAELETAEARMRFMLRMLDTIKSYDSILTTISSNMRMEMRSISIDKRMNSTPDGIRENKIRDSIGFPQRRIPVED